MGGEGLAPVERVRRRPEFKHVYDRGSKSRGRFMTLFVLANGGGTTRLGVAATRKLGSAVERNHAKRLARELFRRHKIRGGVDVVIVPRREILDAPFSTIETDYLSALDRAARSLSRNDSAGGHPARPDSRL